MIASSLLAPIFASAMLATGTPASVAPVYDCPQDDTACLLASIDRKLDRLIELMERDQRRSRWDDDRDGDSSRIDVPVNQNCDGYDCSGLAARICQNGGFTRGVPKEVQSGVWNAILLSATCMD